MRMSNAYITKTLTHILTSSTTPFVTTTTVYMSLHTADPGVSGTNAPVAVPWMPIEFNAPASATCGNATTVDFASMPAVTVTHFGLWDSSATGTATNMFSGEIWGADGSATSKLTNLGDTLRFTSGNIRVRLAS